MEDGALGDTLGDEAQGMVVVDFDGHPQKFDQMEILSQFVAPWKLTAAHRDDLAGRPGNPQEEALVALIRPTVMDMLRGRE